ncbi:MAG: hypothetical protein ACRD98_03700 [Nitrososphaera sp.]
MIELDLYEAVGGTPLFDRTVELTTSVISGAEGILSIMRVGMLCS